MLAGQRGGGSHAQCTRPTERHSTWNAHEKKRKKEKDNAENVDTHEISPIQTYTKGPFGYNLLYSKLKTL